MTKEEMVEMYGAEIPEKYRGWVINRTPPWDKDHYLAVLKVAKGYSYDITDEDKPAVS